MEGRIHRPLFAHGLGISADGIQLLNERDDEVRPGVIKEQVRLLLPIDLPLFVVTNGNYLSEIPWALSGHQERNVQVRQERLGDSSEDNLR